MKLNDKIRSKQDDAFAFVYGIAMSGACDRYVCFTHSFMWLHIRFHS